MTPFVLYLLIVPDTQDLLLQVYEQLIQLDLLFRLVIGILVHMLQALYVMSLMHPIQGTVRADCSPTGVLETEDLLTSVMEHAKLFFRICCY